jgi:hypothetical protein
MGLILADSDEVESSVLMKTLLRCILRERGVNVVAARSLVESLRQPLDTSLLCLEIIAHDTQQHAPTTPTTTPTPPVTTNNCRLLERWTVGRSMSNSASSTLDPSSLGKLGLMF